MTPQVYSNENETIETIETGGTQPVAGPATPQAPAPQAVTPAPVPTATPPAPPSYPPPAPRRQGPSGWRWALGTGLVVIGALSWFMVGWGLVFAGSNAAMAMAVGAIPALTCLAAGWLLQSWTGAVVTEVVYLAVSALMWMLFIVGVGDTQAWAVAFPLYAALPAVVLGAVGTAIGMALAGRRR